MTDHGRYIPSSDTGENIQVDGPSNEEILIEKMNALFEDGGDNQDPSVEVDLDDFAALLDLLETKNEKIHTLYKTIKGEL